MMERVHWSAETR
jgi:4-diphosphocytidyl-2-methyl-D-erithritol synthase